MSMTVTKGTKCPRCQGQMIHKGYDWVCRDCGCVQTGFKDKSNHSPYQMGMFERGNNKAHTAKGER